MRAPREEPTREEPIREEYIERRPYPEYARYPVSPRDVTRWGPIVAGTITALAVLVVLTILGAGVQVLTLGEAAEPLDLATGLGIWAAISTLIALFVGGWLAGWAAGVRGWVSGIAHGTMVWALLLVLSLFLSGIGTANLLGALLGQFEFFVDPGAVDVNLGDTGTAMLWTFVALVVGWAVAAIGGWVGGSIHREPEVAE